MKPRPIRGLGQHFLIDPNIAKKIVNAAGITKKDVVIELGPGLGALTFHLCKAAQKVVGIEIDERVCEYLEGQGLENLVIKRADMLEISFKALFQETGRALKIVSNLPYNISSPMLVKLFDERDLVASALLMVQKEVGERLISPPKTRDYGVLTVLLGSAFKVKRLFSVPPTAFYPKPKVDSIVIGLSRRAHPIEIVDVHIFKRLVRSAFQKRRKTIKNALKGALGSNDVVSEALLSVSITPETRPEAIPVEGYVFLSNHLSRALSKDQG